ncbi:MAG: zf-TFIIB domain-containing protein [Deltaproteobacteria bacterium]|nr:zf-TFIIB domain-containing protein [Deltaproteobacteria bacterium]
MTRTLQSLACPRCRSTALRADGPALCCWRCGGLFLRAALADSVKAALDKRAHVVAERCQASPFARVDLASAAACPVCRAVMRRLPAGTVDVDTCAAHGTWYDAGELRVVRDALMASGAHLEEAPRPAPARPAAPAVTAPPQAMVAASSSGLELADVPRRAQPAVRDELLSNEPYRTSSRGGGALQNPGDAAEATLGMLGTVLGVLGIDVVVCPPTVGHRHRRHRHRRHRHGLVVEAIERAIFE